MDVLLDLVEGGYIPDPLIRWGMRRLLAARLRHEGARDGDTPRAALQRFIAELQRQPIAVAPEKANEQHYEMPPAFFQHILGKRLKYSGCYWPAGVTTLDAAEEAMLQLTCERAQLQDGMDILDLGCGWGSLALWIAEHYPHSQITAVSNSTLQHQFIHSQCRQHALRNVQVITADMNDFHIDRRFDRVISVEMFEHMRNYAQLLARIAVWLKPHGTLFVHLFCHRQYAYPFTTARAADWMGRHFFTGGMMPADDLLLYFQQHFSLTEHWRLNGRHYARTSEAWLHNLDRGKSAVLGILSDCYGTANAALWFRRWRLFFLACTELFRYRRGQEWWVAHYVLRRRAGLDP